jgi:hypothetical protein
MESDGWQVAGCGDLDGDGDDLVYCGNEIVAAVPVEVADGRRRPCIGRQRRDASPEIQAKWIPTGAVYASSLCNPRECR